MAAGGAGADYRNRSRRTTQTRAAVGGGVGHGVHLGVALAGAGAGWAVRPVGLDELRPELVLELGQAHPDAAWVMSENINALLAGKLQRTNQTLRETLERVEQLDAAQEGQKTEQGEQAQPSLLRRLLGGIGT